MADDDKKLDKQKKAPKEKKTKESVEYTSKMWDRIGKSASSKKRKGMKKRVENKKNMDKIKKNLNKKKIETKKSKQKAEKPASKTENKEQKAKETTPVNSSRKADDKAEKFKEKKFKDDKAKEVRAKEVRAKEVRAKEVRAKEVKEEISSKASNKVDDKEEEVTETAPLNPFTDSSLPPQEYEDRYKNMEASEAGDLPPSMVDGEVIIGDVESDVVAQGPKEDKVSDKGILKTKSLDEKPLEDVREAGLESDSDVEVEEKSASDMHQAAEKETQSSEMKSDTDKVKVQEVKEVEVISKKQKENEIKGNLEADVFPTAENLKANKKEFKKELWDVLEQAGLTKKRFFGCLVFILIGILTFFIFSFFAGDDNQKVEEEDEMGNFLLNIVTSYIFGAEESDYLTTNASDTSALTTAFIFGETTLETENDFVDHLNLISRMKNIYNTQLYDYLDKFTDRSQALNDHINELGSIINEAELAMSTLDVELRSMEMQYDTMTSTRDAHENEFFQFLNALNGSEAYYELQIFLEYSRYASEIKANFNAKKTIFSMIDNVLEFLKPRYEDISLNKEALVEGIHVVDVQGSDIDIFIRED